MYELKLATGILSGESPASAHFIHYNMRLLKFKFIGGLHDPVKSVKLRQTPN